METNELRIFEFRSGKSAKEWIAAKTVIKALQLYESITGLEIWAWQEDSDIVELPKDKWEKHTVTNSDGKMTFKQWMELNNKPDFIASNFE